MLIQKEISCTVKLEFILLAGLINWYTQRFSFPFKGLKYFDFILQKFGLNNYPFTKKLPGGVKMKLCINDHIEKYLLWYGYYEKKELDTALSLIGTNSVVIDVGANIGYFSLLFSQKNINGIVYSFEPVNESFLKLKNHILLNKITNIIPLKQAVSDSNSTITMYISNSDNSGMSGLKPAENFSGKTETVECIRLDDAVINYNIPKINLVKIDTEGTEMYVLKGMEEMIRKQKPLLLIEISENTQARYKYNIAAIFDYLQKFEYDFYRVKDINVLEKMSAPSEGDLIFFIPQHYVFPEKIKLF